MASNTYSIVPLFVQNARTLCIEMEWSDNFGKQSLSAFSDGSRRMNQSVTENWLLGGCVVWSRLVDSINTEALESCSVVYFLYTKHAGILVATVMCDVYLNSTTCLKIHLKLCAAALKEKLPWPVPLVWWPKLITGLHFRANIGATGEGRREYRHGVFSTGTLFCYVQGSVTEIFHLDLPAHIT